MFHTISIKCIKHLNGERSVSAIYHLLTGKRSAQTLQDSHIFQLKGYYGIYKRLNKDTFDQAIDQLIQHRYIEIQEDSTATLTEKGKSISFSTTEKNEPQFNGMRYHKIANIFYDRLLLFIQTATNMESGNDKFMPVTENNSVLLWVKKVYNQNKNSLKPFIDNLYNELNSYFQHLPEQEAAIFVQRLTGNSRIGWSKEQLARLHRITISDVELMIMHVIHKLLQKIEFYPTSYPTLSIFTKDLHGDLLITNSANTTYTLLHKGLDINQIAEQRKLKLSTIHDHIVEIALSDPKFPVAPYLSREKIIQINQTAQKLATNRLKAIKEVLGDSFSYFEIRLALATNQGRMSKEHAT